MDFIKGGIILSNRRNPASMGLKMGFNDVADDESVEPKKPPVHYVHVNTNVNVSEFEATHRRNTVWLRDDVDKELSIRVKKRGDKTRIVNEALLNYFSELDKK
jgi:hypothetical protein